MDANGRSQEGKEPFLKKHDLIRYTNGIVFCIYKFMWLTIFTEKSQYQVVWVAVGIPCLGLYFPME
jgi:hypothetical protein